MEIPLVTVVTPSYNQGQFIRATIESVLSQDYPNLEYIIMDGASTDETKAVVKDYSSRVTFISEKDRGQSHAINKGFKMANGSILVWLNSDDLFLPGAVSAAVRGFARSPGAGAVYGNGYLIDKQGAISCPFPCTEPPNLWKLVYLSDYILQQTVYFRKDVLDDIGYIDESLHYVMDWDILIRIGMSYPLEFVDHFMGCLREYPEAKSFAGGAARVREIAAVLRRHTGMRLPPGYVVYGLDTYHKIWCSHVDNRTPRLLKGMSRKLQALITLGAGYIIGRTIRDSQGMYGDGWAARKLHYMLPPGTGSLVLEGTLPDWGGVFEGQTIAIECNGHRLGEFAVPIGDFCLDVEVPAQLQSKLLHLTITASRYLVPGRFRLRGDRRRLAYRFKSIRWSPPRREMKASAASICAT